MLVLSVQVVLRLLCQYSKHMLGSHLEPWTYCKTHNCKALTHGYSFSSWLNASPSSTMKLHALKARSVNSFGQDVVLKLSELDQRAARRGGNSLGGGTGKRACRYRRLTGLMV